MTTRNYSRQFPGVYILKRRPKLSRGGTFCTFVALKHYSIGVNFMITIDIISIIT